MSEVTVDIRKTFNSPPDANPWSWAYERDTVLGTLVDNVASAQAAYNAARSRYLAESFAGSTRYTEVRFLASTIVDAVVATGDDGLWAYEYLRNRKRVASITGLASLDAALTAIRDRFVAESFAGTLNRVKLRLSTEEPA